MIGAALGLALARFYALVLLTVVASRIALNITAETGIGGWMVRALVILVVATVLGYI